MKPRIALAALAAAGVLAAAQQVTAAPTCDITYDAGATGTWTEAAKWDLNRVPAAGEAVCIPATSSVTLSTSVNPGDVDVAGHLTWTSNTMGVPAASAVKTTTIQPGGTLTIAGSVAITGRDLVNGGLLELTVANGYLDGTGTPEPLVRNTGTIRRTTAGIGTIYAQLENDGVVEATAGTLDLRGGGPSSDGGFGGEAGEVRFVVGDYALADGAEWLGGVTQSGGTITIASGTVAATGANAISGGTIAGAGELSIGGPLTWTGGTMTGAGTTEVLGGTTVDMAGTPAIADGRTLANAGTILMSSANGYINATGATEPTLHNTGTIRRTATGAGAVTLYPELDNDGAIEAATAGELDLRGGGAGESAGSFGKLGQAGTVKFTVGDYALADGATWLGGVTMSGGTVTVPDGATVTATGANTIAGGTITGTGTFRIAGPLTWTGGAMDDAGITEVAAGTTVTHAGTPALSDGRSLVNNGTILMTTQNGYVNDTGTRAVSIANAAGAVIRRTATGAGAVTLYPPVQNDGTIRADDGALEMRGGGSGGGDFGPGGGTTVGRVRFVSGTFALGAGARLLGQVEVQGATLGVATGTVTISGAGNKLLSGAIAGAGTVEVTGALAWTGGDMTGTGVTRVKPGATLVLGGSLSLEGGRTLENQGQIDVDGDRFLFDDFAAPAEKLVNTGTIAKTAGTGFGASLGVPLQNAGAVEATVGKLRLGEGGPAPDTGTFEGASRADRVVFEGARTLGGSVQLLGTNEIAGDVGVAAGQTLTSGADLLQSNGDLTGNLTITGTLTWDGGGHVAPGTTTVAPGGRIDLAGIDDACAFASLGEARRLDNQGTLKLTPGADLSTYGETRPLISNPGRIELDAGSGSACGSTTGIYGDALVSNTGTIEKLAGSNGGFIGGTLDNDGEVVSSGGDLSLSTNSAASQAGSFRSTGAGSTVTFEDGVFDLAPTATLAGHTIVGGSSELSIPDGMTLTIPAGDTLEQAGGAVGGFGRLRVAGTLKWDSGEQVGPGSTELQPGATATVPADGFAYLREDRSVVNRGTIDLAGSLYVYQGATLLNESALNLAGAGRIDGFDQYGSGFAGLVHNTGTLTKTGTDPSEASAPVDNDGTIEVLSGTLELPSLLNWSGYGYFGTASGLTGGTFSVKAGSLIIPGPLTANGARLVLDGAGANVLYDPAGFQSPPTDALFALRRNAGNGELVLRGGRDLTIADDYGPFVNQGVLDLGAGSVLQAKGFRQAAGGVLRPAVTAGGAGLVSSTGAAELAGRLDTPSPATVAGDTTILSATSIAGAFTVTGGYAAVPSATAIKLRIPPASGKVMAPAAVAPPAVVEEVEPAALRIAASALETDGPWARRGAYLVAGERGATLRAPAVAGRVLSIVARTGPRAGKVRVTWAGRSRTVSLRSAKPRRRTIRVFALRRARSGAMRITATSKRRVAVRALLVRR